MRIDLDEVQAQVAAIVDTLWPGEDEKNRALALAEEAGEVARATLKRDHARKQVGDRVDERDWDANLRLEVSQVVINCLAIAQAEGWSLREMIEEEVAKLAERMAKYEREFVHVCENLRPHHHHGGVTSYGIGMPRRCTSCTEPIS